MFEKIEDAAIEAQMDKLHNVNTMETPTTLPEIKEEINFDTFSALDLRVGTILAAQKYLKPTSYCSLSGSWFEKRTILSGIAEYFVPNTLVDTKVTVVANLAPRKIRGVVSYGMLLLAEDSAGTLHLFVLMQKPKMEPIR